MKKYIKKIFGIDKIEEAKAKLETEKEALQAARDKAVAETVKAQEEEELAKITPKERATRKKEPWVAVLQTHVNKENLRNGFFELDWNEYFVVQLKQQGYGLDGDPDEEIVDRWFRALCNDIAGDEGINMDRRGAGYINVQQIGSGKSEVS